MVLVGVTDKEKVLTMKPMENKGDLKFKFVQAGPTFPMIMENLNDPMPKVRYLRKTSGRDVCHLKGVKLFSLR